MLQNKLSAAQKITLSQLLDDALDQAPLDRERWIDALPTDLENLKPILKRVVLRENNAFMSQLPQFSIPSDSETKEEHNEAGRIVGPYQLVSELGTGGMGSVWLAVRSDGLINRPVALKLPHGMWRRRDLPERLARERAILATLTHPHIARLYDAGIASDGQPYLALEHVEGMPIDTFCRTHELGINERLRLVVQVTRAVAYAHGKLVVHRDLKPANILVTPQGEVRLLDFGIAKLLEAHTGEKSLTELAGQAFTPDYASPEQISGEPLTVGSDVYSLGVLLFELLTGERPYRLKRASRGALEEAILETSPKRPSEVAPEPWRKRLRGDLDTIVLKALKKDSRERYATAEALADDIERHFAARPVLARPDSARYRVSRFMARNLLPVTVAMIAVLVLLVGSGIVLWQSQVARVERERAEQAKNFIANLFREADPTRESGRLSTAVDLLQQAEARLREQHDADPLLQLELFAIIGESLFGLQQHEDSVRVFQQAFELQRTHSSGDRALAGRLHLGLSRNYELLGRIRESRDEIDRALRMLESAQGEDRILRIQAEIQQAAVSIILEDYEVAEAAAQSAIADARSTFGSRAPAIATALQQLSHIYTLTERRRESVEPAKQAFELVRDIHARNPAHPELLQAEMYYAQALNSSGDFENSAVYYDDTVKRSIDMFGPESHSVGEMLGARGPLEHDRGNLPAAIDDAQRALAIYLKQSERGSSIHASRVRKLGAALLSARRPAEAEKLLAEAVTLAEHAQASLEKSHARVSRGLALALLGRFDEARETLLPLIDKPQTPLSPRANHLAMRNMGALLRLQGHDREALAWLERSIELAALQPSHRGDLAQGLVEAGLAHLALGQTVNARTQLLRASELFDDVQRDRATPARADLWLALGRLHLAEGNLPSAAARLEQSTRYWQTHTVESARWSAEANAWLAICYRRQGREREARELLGRAVPQLSPAAFPTDAALLAMVNGS
jgi:serine/threonine-protein kinase